MLMLITKSPRKEVQRHRKKELEKEKHLELRPRGSREVSWFSLLKASWNKAS